MKIFRTAAMCGILSTLSILPIAANAQPILPQGIQPGSASGQAGATPNWTTEQIVTATVHDAWLLSGKNEATFFEMVAQLATLSAKNRGVTLPDSEAAGRKMGDYIKRTAKLDTDQLLYAVVDKAVVMTTKAPVHPAGAAH
ncbi:hypothetical protein [Granulicella tundricola]|nr:hypothetical protein [Granulicella tundricola]